MKLKYYLRGLGFGILISTIALSLTYGKTTKVRELTDEEIIERAKDLGMEEKSGVTIDRDAINESMKEDDSPNTSKEDGEMKDAPAKEAEQDSKEPEKKEEKTTDDQKSDLSEKKDSGDNTTNKKSKKKKVKTEKKQITVKPGMTAKQVARLLEREGIITDADQFDLYLLENGLTEKILSQKIEVETSYDFAKLADILINEQ